MNPSRRELKDALISEAIKRIDSGAAKHAIEHQIKSVVDPIPASFGCDLLDEFIGTESYSAGSLLYILVRMIDNATILREISDKQRERLHNGIFGPIALKFSAREISDAVAEYDRMRVLDGCKTTVIAAVVLMILFGALMSLSSCGGLSTAVDVYEKLSEQSKPKKAVVDTAVYKIIIISDTLHVMHHHDTTGRR